MDLLFLLKYLIVMTPPIKSVNSVCTYSVVASLVLLSFADAVTPVAAAPALKVAPVESVVPV